MAKINGWFGDIKVTRKQKKQWLGRRINKSKLRKMIAETIVGDPIVTMYERVEFTPHGAFCPKCGCKDYYGTGNRSGYPEHWEYFLCTRCGNTVGYIDNSPFIHALECKEFDYNPIF